MSRLYILIFIFFNFVLNAQLKEVERLKLLEKKYDSILISYQKKAKDSLSHLKKDDRNEIMVIGESKIIEKKRVEEYAQLKRIKKEELDLESLNLPEKYARCNMGVEFEMPNLLKKSKYKPTISKKTKHNLKGDGSQLSSVVTFTVTADGYIKKVDAEGKDDEFNRELELTLYKLEKMRPRCMGGISKTEKYRMPVQMNFNN